MERSDAGRTCAEDEDLPLKAAHSREQKQVGLDDIHKIADDAHTSASASRSNAQDTLRRARDVRARSQQLRRKIAELRRNINAGGASQRSPRE
jgi:hypothetical protein